MNPGILQFQIWVNFEHLLGKDQFCVKVKKKKKPNMRNKFSPWCLCLLPSASCSPVCRLHDWLFWLGPEEPWVSLTYAFFFSSSFWSINFCSLQFTLTTAKAHLRGKRRRADFQRRLRRKGSPWVSKETNMFYIKFPWKKCQKKWEMLKP